MITVEPQRVTILQLTITLTEAEARAFLADPTQVQDFVRGVLRDLQQSEKDKGNGHHPKVADRKPIEKIPCPNGCGRLVGRTGLAKHMELCRGNVPAAG